ncbi:hypothetical protein OG225_16875 [Nocardia sp. NBC_01377]|uniref:flavodoxin family protein n=1 Tax=Nocardia sp. NBC_01377 TaxID=2903595 RepID=UPI00324A55A6
MHALVVYESMFGNTAAVAEKIAGGLAAAYSTVDRVDVAAAVELPEHPVDLLVVGGPTHAFGLSRPKTRQDAAARAPRHGGIETGVREWLAALSPAAPHAQAAAFGTRADKKAWLTGSAARGIGKRLRHLGYQLVVPPEDFTVEKILGPLSHGELARARNWGEQLAYTQATPHRPPV